MAATIELKNSITTTNAPSTLAQGETAWNITDKKVWVGNASSTPIQLIGAGASMTLTSLTTSSDSTIHGLTVGLGGGNVAGNTALGVSALQANTSGANSTGIGNGSLYSNTSGSYNLAIGSTSVGGYGTLSLNTSGSYNIALGNGALAQNTTASNNTAVGYQAGYSNSTGSLNLYLGYQAGYSNTTGIANTFIGYGAGFSAVSSGSSGGNTFVGYNAGSSVTTGVQNTFVGPAGAAGAVGSTITTGSQNTILGGFIGNQGGLDIRTASNYIVLSDGAGNPRGVFDGSGNFITGGATAFGAYNTSSVGFRIGSSGVTFSAAAQGSGGNFYLNQFSATGSTSYIYFLYNGAITASISGTSTLVSYNVTSDYRLKNNPTKITTSGTFIDDLNPVSWTWVQDGSKGAGFLAHEFQKVSPTSVTGEKDAVDAKGNPIYQAMDSSNPEVMANIIAEIQSLRKRIATLEVK